MEGSWWCTEPGVVRGRSRRICPKSEVTNEPRQPPRGHAADHVRRRSINSQGKGLGASASIQDQDRVIVRIPDLPDIPVRPAWTMNSPGMAARSTNNRVEAAKREFLEKFYNDNVWVLFGCGYGNILVPAARHEETVTALRKTPDGASISYAERQTRSASSPL
jgi:hypothetical protein